MLTTEKKLEYADVAEDSALFHWGMGKENAPSVTEKEYFMIDDVASPSHYKVFPDTEAIDIIREVLTTDELIGYYKGTILAYRLRAGKKDDAVKDLDKAAVYEEWLNQIEKDM